MFLNNENKKIIPSNIGEYLNSRSLAFWIMDDGQRVKRGGVTLCTDSFNSEEIEILRQALKASLNLTTSIHRKKKDEAIYERIYINKNSLDEIPQLKEHMHDSMLYKINELSNETSVSTLDANEKPNESSRLNLDLEDVTDFGSDIGDF